MYNKKYLFSLLALSLFSIMGFGQMIKSSDSKKLITKELMLQRFDSMMRISPNLSSSDYNLLKSVIVCYVDTVPQNLSYTENILLLSVNVPMEQKISIFSRNKVAVNSFFALLKERHLDTHNLHMLFTKVLTDIYCFKLVGNSLSSNKAKIVCECVNADPPELTKMFNNEEEYFEDLLNALKKCVDGEIYKD